ncbi:Transcription antitermination protein NusG [Lachnospiraceae bacterium TWA4]|nr:Transcription antitermination protein NusG [Lachnospiraceae bacterium TWA4]
MTADAADKDKIETESAARWYVVHTYSGYENKVKTDLKKTIENRKLHDQILEVIVPLQNVTEMVDKKVTETVTGEDGKPEKVKKVVKVEKVSQKKVFPGYVLIHMVMTDDTWYVVRNTRGVTGFVGPESKPVPLTLEEMNSLFSSDVIFYTDLEVGDMVTVTNGMYKGTTERIQSINLDKRTVKINIERGVGGQKTSLELGFSDVEKSE